MVVVRRFIGYDDEAFRVSIMKSLGWKSENTDVKSGDLLEIIATEVPVYVDESKKVEIKRIGVVKRNSVNFIGAGMGKITVKSLMGKLLTNAYGNSLLSGSLGNLVLPVDGNQAAIKVPTCTLIDSYTIKPPAGVSNWDDIYNETLQNQIIGIYKDGKLLDIDCIIGLDGNNAKVAGKLDDSALNLDDTTTYDIKALIWIDVDEVPNQLLDFVVQRASRYDLELDPEFDGAYSGSETVILKNASGNITFDLPLQEQPTVEFEMFADDHYLVNPTPESLPAKILVSGTGTGSLDFSVRLRGKGSFVETALAQTGTTAQLTADAIATAVDALTNFSATVPNPSIPEVVITSTIKEFAVVDVSTKDSYDSLVTLNEANNWEKYNQENCSQIPSGAIDTGVSGSVSEAINVALSGTVFNNGSIVRLKVNGVIYDYVIADGDTANEIAIGLSTLIENDEFVFDGENLRELSYNSVPGVGELDITATNFYTKLTVEFEVIDAATTGKTDVTAVITKTLSSLSPVYTDDDAPFFKLSKTFIGDSGSKMYSFCEVAGLTLNFARTIEEIKSICSNTGRKGWNNTQFTIMLDVETTDVDAERVHRIFDYYKNNKTFALAGFDKDSGFGFHFPKCRVETFEKSAQDNLQGHSFSFNVNWDPNTKPLISLHQSLDY